jgi:hypothetical protein
VTVILRDVLARWDFRDPAGWRADLDAVLRLENRALRPGLELMLDGVARWPLRAELAAAREVRREVLYALDLGGESEPLPVIEGLLDTLWQDAARGWHLLFWNVPPRTENEAWAAHHVAVMLGVEALLRAGVKVKSIRLFRLGEGEMDQRRPPTAKTRAAFIEEARMALRRQRERRLT